MDRRVKSLVAERKNLAKEGFYTFLTHGIAGSGKCDCGDPHCDRPAKHPRFKGKDRGATIDPAQIEREIRYPSSNIGVHCGLSGLVVIDIDPRNGGWETLAALEAEHGLLEAAIVADTGGGGQHRYFRARAVSAYPSSLGAGVDVQSGNKYVIVPPSRHCSGGTYRWRDGCDPSSALLLSYFPDALMSDVTSHSGSALAELEESDGEVGRLRSALESIPADCSRNEWRDVLFAIHSTGWSCAEDLGREWSQRALHLWSESEFSAIWRSADAAREGGRTVRSIYYAAARNGWIDPNAVTCAETLGDIDNGRRFAVGNRDCLIFDRATGKWREYVQGIWRLCETGQEVAAAKAVAEANLREAGQNLFSSPSDASKAAYGQALKVHRSAPRIAALIEMAKAEPGMSVADPTTFDRDPFLLGVAGGAIDLRSGKWLSPSPALMLSKCVGVRYDASATCPRWEAFVHDTLANDDEVSFLQRFAGYSLTGSVDEEVFVFMQGAGANGKSVMANVLSGVLGDYAVTVGSELLAVTKHESEVARLKVRLRGARMAMVNEVAQSDTFNDQRIKEIVSREAISSRYLYGEAFDFFPTHKLWVRGNHRPAILDSGDGMWRRIILLPFARQFSTEERVRNLDRQLLQDEGSGILNWCIAGCLQWRKVGLQVPPSILRETAQYRDDTDVVGEWIASECDVRSNTRCHVALIFASYRDFHMRLGMTPKTQPAFVRMMSSKGFRRTTSNGHSYLTGIDLSLGGL